MKPVLNKIKETAINIINVGRTEDFYHGIFGLEIISKDDNMIFFRVGTDLLLCFITENTKEQTTPPPHAASGKQHFAFECNRNDYQKWKDVLKEKNIVMEMEITWKTGKRSFYFRDPDGHCVEIIEPMMWGF